MYREMTSVEILEDALETVKSGWTQGANARDANWNLVPPTDESACRWCLIGSVYRSVGYSSYSPNRDCELQLKDSTRVFSLLEGIIGRELVLSSWNDDVDRTQADVLNLLNEALEKEKSK